MQQTGGDPEIVFNSTERSSCLELRLVLQAVGIPAEAFVEDGRWYLVVEHEQAQSARQELAEYQRDKQETVSTPEVELPERVGVVEGAILYAVTLVLVGTVAWSAAVGQEWMDRGHMRAGDVLAGEWWRTVTALTLHVDGLHLLSNLGFGCVFGFLTAQVLGGGVAWLTIVLAGSLGNLLNAYWRSAEHTSIGASTAVFAALGAMVAIALRPTALTRLNRMKRWSPLIGGVLLLALTGTGGERTDVSAHIAGFLTGLFCGWIAARLPDAWLANPTVQWSAGVLALLCIAFAWTSAFLFAA